MLSVIYKKKKKKKAFSDDCIERYCTFFEAVFKMSSFYFSKVSY